jgi:hypothetical protein
MQQGGFPFPSHGAVAVLVFFWPWIGNGQVAIDSVSDVTDVAGQLIPTTAAPDQCDCNCCQVEERVFSEIMTLPGGKVLKHKCASPQRNENDENVLERCSATCFVDGGHEEGIEKFCLDACVPLAATIGGKCEHYEEATGMIDHNVDDALAGQLAATTGGATGGATEAAGGGWGDPGIAGEGLRNNLRSSTLGAGASGGSGVALSPAEIAERAAEVGKAEGWDTGFLTASRLRAQAGAAVARAAESGEHVRTASLSSKWDSKFLSQLALEVSPALGASEADAADAESNQSAAKEALVNSSAMVKEAEHDAPILLASTRNYAVEEIRRRLGPIIAQEAHAKAKRLGWDKPPSYGKLYAYHAGESIMQEASRALKRAMDSDDHASELEREVEYAGANIRDMKRLAAVMERQGADKEAWVELDRVAPETRRKHQLEAEALELRKLASKDRSRSLELKAKSAEKVREAWAEYAQTHPGSPAPPAKVIPLPVVVIP